MTARQLNLPNSNDILHCKQLCAAALQRGKIYQSYQVRHAEDTALGAFGPSTMSTSYCRVLMMRRRHGTGTVAM
jgi:hypothetical protein